MRRRLGRRCALEVEESIDQYVLDLLVRELKISEAEVYPLPGPLDLHGLFGIGALDRPELKYPKFIAGTHRDLAEVESASAPTCSPCASVTSCCTTRTTPSPPPCRPSWSRRRPIRTCWPSSRRCTDLGRLADRRRADRRRRVRQAGPRPRRDQGALRRTGQHQVGPRARGVGLPCGVRARRAEDPLQAVAGRPAGGETLRRYSHVGTGNYHPRAPPAVRGPRPAHRRPAGRRGPVGPLQPALRLLAP